VDWVTVRPAFVVFEYLHCAEGKLTRVIDLLVMHIYTTSWIDGENVVAWLSLHGTAIWRLREYTLPKHLQTKFNMN
jgi:hypothetical protein